MLHRVIFLFPYFRRYRGRLAAGVACILGSAAVGLLTPLLVGRAVDALRQDISRRALLIYAGLLIAIELVRGVFTFSQRLLLVVMSRNIEFDLRNRYFDKLLTLSQRFFHDHPTGDLMARATKDLEAVRQIVGPAIMYGSNTLFTSIGALSVMVWIDPLLTLVALSTLPLVAVATKVFGAKIHHLFEEVQAGFGDLSTRVQENLAGVRVVRAYAQEEGERQLFERANRKYVGQNRRLIRVSSAFHPLLQALVGISFVAVLWYGGLLAARGSISVGELVTFLLLLAKMVWPMIAIGWVINLVQRGTASLGRMRRIFDAEPEIQGPENAGPRDAGEAPGEEPAARRGEPVPIRGAIRFSELDFAYDGGPPVLAGIDFAAPAGATVALVGRTGAGKSTLLSLIPRIIDPPPGSLSIDGVDVRRLPLADLRAAIAMVPQETFLFSTTVRENIAFGRPDASDEEVLGAAELAGLAPDVASFPRGLDTLVGERGITLSGGQKQRVALARALVREPRILLLDDCLSAVDTQTEERILGNLRQVFPGRTVLLVSHRISAVQGADLILVLDGGEIVERGTHGELLAADGLYADLYQRQMLEEELAQAT